MKYIVYQTTNIVNNKIYIGVHKTDNPDIFDGYIGNGCYIHSPSSYMNPSTPYQAALKKYGPGKFIRTTLKCFDNPTDAYDLERFLVDKDFLRRKDTYNACLGGIDAPTNGIPVYQFDLKGKLLKKWNSTLEVAEFYNISSTAIYNAVHYKGSCLRYFWSKNDFINIEEYTLDKQGTKCYRYDAITKTCIGCYNSIVEAARDMKVSMSSMQRAVHSGYKIIDSYFSDQLMDEYIVHKKVSLKDKKLYIYDLSGNYVTELSTKEEIFTYFNINNVSNLCSAIRANKPFKGFQISLTKESKLSEVENKQNIKKKVGKFDTVGNLIEIYESINEAKIKNGPGCQKVLRGQQKIYKNHIYKYMS